MTTALVERVARAIAGAHGAKMVYKDNEGTIHTVSSMAGCGPWASGLERYAETRWKQYEQAAQSAIDVVRRHLLEETYGKDNAKFIE